MERPLTGHSPESSQKVLAGLPPTLDVTAAAKLLGIGRTTAYALARQNRLPFPVIKVGRQYRVPTSLLLQLLGLPGPAPRDANDGA